jgi:hypothetical protein
MARGQSALEYLVTYGWAILGIVIIAGVLVTFGIFDPSKWGPSRMQGGFASLEIIDHKVIAGTGGTLQLMLANKRGRSVTITAINVSSGGCNWSGSQVLSATGQKLFTTSACTAATVTGASEGSAYDFSDIEVAFTDSTSGLTHGEIGFIKGTFQ